MPGRMAGRAGQRSDGAAGEDSRRWRRTFEVGFWISVIAFFWTLDTLTKLEERRRTGVGLDDFRLFTEQATSALAVFVMIGFVAYWLRQFPLDRSRPLPTLIGHVVGSVLFAIGHYGLMVLFRRVVFGLNGMEYMPDQNHLPNLVFEYKKDIKIYLIAVAIIAVYRHLRAQRRTTDGRTEGPQGGDDPAASPSPKLAVQTPKGERLLEIDRIDYLEAARNYVEVHVGGERYLVRSSLSALARRLPEARFLRIHRSFLVNAEAITELRTSDSSQRLVLRGGAEVPISRGYRDTVRSRLEELQV